MQKQMRKEVILDDDDDDDFLIIEANNGLCLFLVHNAAYDDNTSTNNVTAGRRKQDSLGIDRCCMASANDTDSFSDTAYRQLSDGCQTKETHCSRLPRLLTVTKVLYGIS